MALEPEKMVFLQEPRCGHIRAVRSLPPLLILKERCLRVWRSLNPLLSDSIVLSAGTVLGAAATILSAPIISRLYEPSTFGMFAVYMSLLAIVTPVASLRYEMAIPIEKDDIKAANILVVSISIALLTSLIAVGIAIWHPSLASQFAKDPGAKRYLVLLPIAFCCTAVYQVLASWAVRSRAFPQIARTRVSQSMGCAGVQLSVGILTGSTWGLFFGDLVSRAGGTGLLLSHLLRTWPTSALSLQTALAAMRRYVRFPLFTTLASVLTMAGSQLPVLILSRSFGLEVAGWYALTSRVLGTPGSLIGQAIGQAFLGHGADLKHQKDELRAMTESTAAWVFVVGLPVFIFISMEGKELFAALFGARWAVAGIYAEHLAPMFCLWMVASPLNHLLTIREWQGTTVGFSFLNCVITVASLIAGIWLKSPGVGIAALGIGLFFLMAANLQRLFRAGYSDWGRVLRRVAPMMGCAILAIVPIAFAIRSPALWAISTRFLASCFLYLCLLRAWRLYPSASWNAFALVFENKQ